MAPGEGQHDAARGFDPVLGFDRHASFAPGQAFDATAGYAAGLGFDARAGFARCASFDAEAQLTGIGAGAPLLHAADVGGLRDVLVQGPLPVNGGPTEGAAARALAAALLPASGVDADRERLERQFGQVADALGDDAPVDAALLAELRAWADAERDAIVALDDWKVARRDELFARLEGDPIAQALARERAVASRGGLDVALAEADRALAAATDRAWRTDPDTGAMTRTPDDDGGASALLRALHGDVDAQARRLAR